MDRLYTNSNQSNRSGIQNQSSQPNKDAKQFSQQQQESMKKDVKNFDDIKRETSMFLTQSYLKKGGMYQNQQIAYQQIESENRKIKEQQIKLIEEKEQIQLDVSMPIQANDDINYLMSGYKTSDSGDKNSGITNILQNRNFHKSYSIISQKGVPETIFQYNQETSIKSYTQQPTLDQEIEKKRITADMMYPLDSDDNQINTYASLDTNVQEISKPINCQSSVQTAYFNKKNSMNIHTIPSLQVPTSRIDQQVSKFGKQSNSQITSSEIPEDYDTDFQERGEETIEKFKITSYQFEIVQPHFSIKSDQIFNPSHKKTGTHSVSFQDPQSTNSHRINSSEQLNSDNSKRFQTFQQLHQNQNITSFAHSKDFIDDLNSNQVKNKEYQSPPQMHHLPFSIMQSHGFHDSSHNSTSDAIYQQQPTRNSNQHSNYNTTHQNSYQISNFNSNLSSNQNSNHQNQNAIFQNDKSASFQNDKSASFQNDKKRPQTPTNFRDEFQYNMTFKPENYLNSIPSPNFDGIEKIIFLDDYNNSQHQQDYISEDFLILCHKKFTQYIDQPLIFINPAFQFSTREKPDSILKIQRNDSFWRLSFKNEILKEKLLQQSIISSIGEDIQQNQQNYVNTTFQQKYSNNNNNKLNNNNNNVNQSSSSNFYLQDDTLEVIQTSFETIKMNQYRPTLFFQVKNEKILEGNEYMVENYSIKITKISTQNDTTNSQKPNNQTNKQRFFVVDLQVADLHPTENQAQAREIQFNLTNNMKYIIGRNVQCNLCLGNRSTISAKHCYFEIGADNQIYINDYQSSNGTWKKVNQIDITKEYVGYHFKLDINGQEVKIIQANSKGMANEMKRGVCYNCKKPEQDIIIFQEELMNSLCIKCFQLLQIHDNFSIKLVS